MQENNQKDTFTAGSAPEVVPEVKVESTENPEPTVSVSTENNASDSGLVTATVPATETTTETVTAAAEAVAVTTAVSTSKLSPTIKKYLIAAAVIIVIGVILLIGLERQGRINTGLFNFPDNTPAALVNDVVVKKVDYDSSVTQLLEMAASQGVDTTDPAVIEQYETQAIDTLVNGELLRQAALEAGKEATKEAIDARFGEIEAGIGGPEVLAERMLEYGITEATLRRDIENEILIQALFDDVIKSQLAEVTDAEISAFYDQLGGAEANIPPLEEVRDQVAEQIRLDQEQKKIGEYIDTLRAAATIEVLI